MKVVQFHSFFQKEHVRDIVLLGFCFPDDTVVGAGLVLYWIVRLVAYGTCCLPPCDTNSLLLSSGSHPDQKKQTWSPILKDKFDDVSVSVGLLRRITAYRWNLELMAILVLVRLPFTT